MFFEAVLISQGCTNIYYSIDPGDGVPAVPGRIVPDLCLYDHPGRSIDRSCLPEWVWAPEEASEIEDLEMHPF